MCRHCSPAGAKSHEIHDASFVVVTGDLSHWGEARAYAALAEELSRLRMPVRLLIGNHDDRSLFREIFAEEASDGDGHVQFAFTRDGVRFIAAPRFA